MHMLGVENVPGNASNDQNCADNDPDQPGIVGAARALAVQAVEALQTLNALFTSVPGSSITFVLAVANTSSNTPRRKRFSLTKCTSTTKSSEFTISLTIN